MWCSERGESNLDRVTYWTPITFGAILLAALWLLGNLANAPIWHGSLNDPVRHGALVYIPIDQGAGGLPGAGFAMGYGIWRSLGRVKTSDGEILSALVTVGLMAVRASASDPLSIRLITCAINTLLLVTASVQLDSGRRMGAASILIHGVVTLLADEVEPSFHLPIITCRRAEH